MRTRAIIGGLPGRSALSVLLAAAIPWSAAHGEGPGRPVVHTVVIEAMAFSPPAVEARRGDVIVWVNRDAFPHNATAEDRSFASGPIPPGGSWRLAAGRAGSVGYLCTLHPVMKGRLAVK